MWRIDNVVLKENTYQHSRTLSFGADCGLRIVVDKPLSPFEGLS